MQSARFLRVRFTRKFKLGHNCNWDRDPERRQVNRKDIDVSPVPLAQRAVPLCRTWCTEQKLKYMTLPPEKVVLLLQQQISGACLCTTDARIASMPSSSFEFLLSSPPGVARYSHCPMTYICIHNWFKASPDAQGRPHMKLNSGPTMANNLSKIPVLANDNARWQVFLICIVFAFYFNLHSRTPMNRKYRSTHTYECCCVFAWRKNWGQWFCAAISRCCCSCCCCCWCCCQQSTIAIRRTRTTSWSAEAERQEPELSPPLSFSLSFTCNCYRSSPHSHSHPPAPPAVRYICMYLCTYIVSTVAVNEMLVSAATGYLFRLFVVAVWECRLTLISPSDSRLTLTSGHVYFNWGY